MKCPKCDSENISIVLEKKRSGLFDILGIIFLLLIPIIGWVILLFNSHNKEIKIGLCQNCAYSSPLGASEKEKNQKKIQSYKAVSTVSIFFTIIFLIVIIMSISSGVFITYIRDEIVCILIVLALTTLTICIHKRIKKLTNTIVSSEPDMSHPKRNISGGTSIAMAIFAFAFIISIVFMVTSLYT